LKLLKKNKNMKKLLTLLLLTLSSVAFAQKPMVGFTITEIKERNRIEFKTTNWERINMEKYWCIYTIHPNYDLMSMYFFEWGKSSNVMCTQTTKSDEVARAMLRRIIDTHHNLGENKYLNESGVLVDYSWQEDLKAHRFMYYDPDGKNPFAK
jgi:hypothetical protein